MKLSTRAILIWAVFVAVAAHFWYWFKDRVNPEPKVSHLEKDIQDFERWQKQ